MMNDQAPIAAARTPDQLVDDLRQLLAVEQIDVDLYRGARQPGGVGRVYGGQVIAQALVAAGLSTPAERIVHSLHAYFMRPGDEEVPIIYRVARDHDGGSFSTRRVIAFQHGKPILTMTSSFQTLEAGLSHQSEMPDTPAPETLVDEADQRRAVAAQVPERFREWFLRPRAFEVRLVDLPPWLSGAAAAPTQRIWFRAVAPVGDDARMHRAMLGYLSDMYLLGTSTRPHGVNWMVDAMQTASLDHSMWLHDDIRIDDWLLYVTDSPWAGRGRGFARGEIFSRDGRLVASVAQEGLIRRRNPR
ncbi:acyl-CoA thioesterase-2 [Sphingomonas jejuensis]|uniref:Acyl-CoA thioesterase-2 n=2 Tax=Sphingomonas jejuensis TaxID=904715 RepID=A0ABX0XNP4_9SPHN|nr:acyl-CoA thioesterase-2 [Sphingomonas jejuensis]